MRFCFIIKGNLITRSNGFIGSIELMEQREERKDERKEGMLPDVRLKMSRNWGLERVVKEKRRTEVVYGGEDMVKGGLRSINNAGFERNFEDFDKNGKSVESILTISSSNYWIPLRETRKMSVIEYNKSVREIKIGKVKSIKSPLESYKLAAKNIANFRPAQM